MSLCSCLFHMLLFNAKNFMPPLPILEDQHMIDARRQGSQIERYAITGNQLLLYGQPCTIIDDQAGQARSWQL